MQATTLARLFYRLAKGLRPSGLVVPKRSKRVRAAVNETLRTGMLP